MDIELMLFSFAVECWLKGLIVAMLRQPQGTPKADELMRRLSEVPPELSADQVWKLIETDFRQEAQEAHEESNRIAEKAAITQGNGSEEHRHHRLVELAYKAGVVIKGVGADGTSVDLEPCLVRLEALNQLGRYPTAHKKYYKDSSFTITPEERAAVCRAIRERYDELVAVPELSRLSGEEPDQSL